MKSISIRTVLLCLVLFVAAVATSARAESDLDFGLVNKTGYDIKEVYIGPTSSDDWGDNILKSNLKDGATLSVSFSPKATAAKWDIKVVYDDGDKAEWRGYKLKEITTISLFYDKDKDKTTAKTE